MVLACGCPRSDSVGLPVPLPMTSSSNDNHYTTGEVAGTEMVWGINHVVDPLLSQLTTMLLDGINEVLLCCAT
jgi:hypothetical protein